MAPLGRTSGVNSAVRGNSRTLADTLERISVPYPANQPSKKLIAHDPRQSAKSCAIKNSG